MIIQFNPILVIAALIATVLCSCIGIYAFYENPQKIENRVFLLFIFFVVVDSIAEVLLGLSSSPAEGLPFIRLGFFGIIFISPAALHLATVFPKERKKISRNGYFLFSLYLIPTIIYGIFNNMLTIEDIELTEWGYRFAMGPDYIFVVYWCLIVGLLTVILFLYSFIRHETVLEGKQMRLVFYGFLLLLILLGGANAVAPILDYNVFPMGVASFSILAIFIASSIQNYDLFLLRPMIIPGLESIEARPKKHNLEQGMSYAVYEDGEVIGYEVFTDQITHGISGLCITKYQPEEIRRRYEIIKTPLVWFTFKECESEVIIDPNRLDIDLITQIEEFLKIIEKKIIFFDCFDQILLVIGFDGGISLLENIKCICKEKESILLLSINLNLFSRDQIKIIREEFLEVL
ncbi:MAG: DUF835 domain-containing protein [Halobacteriota archaeon]|nr:DUF835 domain-containing protein [Halobacteriota archaeon]